MPGSLMLATPRVFETYFLKRVSAPSLPPGQEVVVMDNLSAHKGGRMHEIVYGVAAKFPTLHPTRRTSIL